MRAGRLKRRGPALLPPPSQDMSKEKQNTHQDLAHPINQEFRDYLQSKVLDSYYKEKESAGEKATEQESAPAEAEAETEQS